jgi:hypothetical protein
MLHTRRRHSAIHLRVCLSGDRAGALQITNENDPDSPNDDLLRTPIRRSVTFDESYTTRDNYATRDNNNTNCQQHTHNTNIITRANTFDCVKLERMDEETNCISDIVKQTQIVLTVANEATDVVCAKKGACLCVCVRVCVCEVPISSLG